MSERASGHQNRNRGVLRSCSLSCGFVMQVALVDAGVRATEKDRSAYIFLPGGLGTLDELAEIMTLMQLGKLGS